MYNMPVDKLLLSTADDIPGYTIKEYKGVVWGVTVRAKNLGQDCLAGCKNVTGGESSSYTNLQNETRQQSLDRLMEQCKRIGGNGVVALRFETGSSVQGFIEVVAYGTAVLAEKNA
jgi:uncharacterized protein YbjQ (UPF0145 family)